MSSIVLESRTGPDGMLHLDVPLGAEQANQTVRIVIETLPKPKTQAEWAAWVASVTGSITDPTFMRHEQGEFETREELS